MLSRQFVDSPFWMPAGAAIDRYCARRPIVRCMAEMLKGVFAKMPARTEWRLKKAHLSSYQLDLYVAAGIVGALTGVAICAIALLLR